MEPQITVLIEGCALFCCLAEYRKAVAAYREALKSGMVTYGPSGGG